MNLLLLSLLPSAHAEPALGRSRATVLMLAGAEPSFLVDTVALRTLYHDALGIDDLRIITPRDYLSTRSTVCSTSTSTLPAHERAIAEEVAGASGRWWIESAADLDALFAVGGPLDKLDLGADELLLVHVLGHGADDGTLSFAGSACEHGFQVAPEDLVDRIARLSPLPPAGTRTVANGRTGPLVGWFSNSCHGARQTNRVEQAAVRAGMGVFVQANVSGSSLGYMLPSSELDVLRTQFVERAEAQAQLLPSVPAAVAKVWGPASEVARVLQYKGVFGYAQYLWSVALLQHLSGLGADAARTEVSLSDVSTSLTEIERLRQTYVTRSRYDATWPAARTGRWDDEAGVLFERTLTYSFASGLPRGAIPSDHPPTQEQLVALDEALLHELEHGLGGTGSVRQIGDPANATFRCGVEPGTAADTWRVVCRDRSGTAVAGAEEPGRRQSDELRSLIPPVARDLLRASRGLRLEAWRPAQIAILVDLTSSNAVNDPTTWTHEDVRASLRYELSEALLHTLTLGGSAPDVRLYGFTSSDGCTTPLQELGPTWWRLDDESARTTSLDALAKSLRTPPCGGTTDIAGALGGIQWSGEGDRAVVVLSDGGQSTRVDGVLVMDGDPVRQPLATTVRSLAASGVRTYYLLVQQEYLAPVREALLDPAALQRLKTIFPRLPELPAYMVQLDGLDHNRHGAQNLQEAAADGRGVFVEAANRAEALASLARVAEHLRAPTLLDLSLCSTPSQQENDTTWRMQCRARVARGEPVSLHLSSPEGFQVCAQTISAPLPIDVPVRRTALDHLGHRFDLTVPGSGGTTLTLDLFLVRKGESCP